MITSSITMIISKHIAEIVSAVMSNTSFKDVVPLLLSKSNKN